jgi:hypothetical protein
MHINLSKLETGDKVAFSGRVEKTVSHICRDNIRVRSVSFDDGTILNWDDSLWELAESTGAGVIWESGEYMDQTGYESEEHKALKESRFYLVDDTNKFVLTESITFPSEDTAKIYANKRLEAWRSSCGN